MGRALHDESPRYRDMSFNEQKLEALAVRLQGTLLASDAAILVADLDGELIGMFIGVISERWFSDDKFVTDLTLYVKPEHRGGSSFLRLIKAFEAWAASQGVHDIAIGVSTEIHAARTVRAYEVLGYRLAGYTMVKHGH